VTFRWKLHFCDIAPVVLLAIILILMQRIVRRLWSSFSKHAACIQMVWSIFYIGFCFRAYTVSREGTCDMSRGAKIKVKHDKRRLLFLVWSNPIWTGKHLAGVWESTQYSSQNTGLHPGLYPSVRPHLFLNDRSHLISAFHSSLTSQCGAAWWCGCCSFSLTPTSTPPSPSAPKCWDKQTTSSRPASSGSGSCWCRPPSCSATSSGKCKSLPDWWFSVIRRPPVACRKAKVNTEFYIVQVAPALHEVGRGRGAGNGNAEHRPQQNDHGRR